MKSNTKQTKIPFTERKLRVRNNKCVTPKKIDTSEDETSPLKYKLVVRSESKIVLRRSSRCADSPKRGAGKKPEKKTEDACPTPPKRNCCLDKPKTPENGGFTPSGLLSKLQLSSAKGTKKDTNKEAETPKRCFTPKELFPGSGNASSARKALYSSSSTLPCREDEIDKLHKLLEKHLEEQSCGSIYISGLPGTGKTASVEHVVQTEKLTKGYHIVKINCTSINTSASIYKRICSELKIKNGSGEKDPKVLIEKFLFRKHKMILLILDEIDQLETRSQSVLYRILEWPSWPKARLVLIGIANAMDLTDRLLPRLCAKAELKPVLIHFSPYSKDQIKKILSHRLSEVGAHDVFTPSAIELISAKVAGMSGDVRRALDLGRRVVEVSEETKAAVLEGNRDKSPQKRIGPNGINPSALADFLRLNDCRRSPRKVDKSVDPMSNIENTPTKTTSVPFLSPKRTPQSQSRKRLFDEEPGEERNGSGSVLKEMNGNRGAVSPCKRQLPFGSPRKHTTTTTTSKADFSIDSKDVLNVVKNIYGTSKSLKSHTEDSSFPLHQKLLISTFLLISKRGKVKDLNVGKLHQVYTKICTKRGITPVDLSGFLFLCRQVEMTGIMLIGKGPGKLAKVSLQWDEAEVTDALKDQNLLSSILSDDSCL